MSITAQALDIWLPAPFDTAEMGAWLDGGRRKLTWRLHAPEGAELCRNRYTWAWFEVREERPFGNEVTWLSTERRVTESGARSSFTDVGRDQLRRLLLPAVNKHFTALWCDTRARMVEPDKDQEQSLRAETEVIWWQAKRDLAQMQRDGVLQFRGIEVPMGQRTPTVTIVSPHSTYGREHPPIVAEAIFQSEVVGYLVGHGELVPIGGVTS